MEKKNKKLFKDKICRLSLFNKSIFFFVGKNVLSKQNFKIIEIQKDKATQGEWKKFILK